MDPAMTSTVKSSVQMLIFMMPFLVLCGVPMGGCLHLSMPGDALFCMGVTRLARALDHRRSKAQPPRRRSPVHRAWRRGDGDGDGVARPWTLPHPTILAATLALLGVTATAKAAPADVHDWGSLPSLLHSPSWLNLELNLNAEPLGNPAGGISQSAEWMQQLVLHLEAGAGLGKDQTQWSEFEHWKVHAELTLLSGDPFLNDTIGAAFPLQAVANPIGLWPTELSLERANGRGPWLVKAGLMSANPSFLAAPAYDFYIHSALNNTLNEEVVGLPLNPYVAPGIVAQLTTGNSSDLRIGAFSLDPVNAIASVFGVDTSQPKPEGNLQLLQWNLRQLPGSKALDHPIPSSKGPVKRQLPEPLLQLGGMRAHTRLDTRNVASIGAGENWGAFGSVTVPAPFPLGLDHRLWISGRVGFNPRNNPAPTFLGMGWLSQGVLPCRPLDVLAVGFGRTSFSPAITPSSSYEAVVEVNYTYSVNNDLSLQPLVQWIVNPGGTGTTSGIFATGLQVNFRY